MASNKKLTRSASNKAYFKTYSASGRHEKNKIARMNRTAKNQPNNLQVAVALEKVIKKGIKYVRNRKSLGHTCKGLYKELGFIKNQMSESMIKGKLNLHRYSGTAISFAGEPNHGQSMGTQLAILGFKIRGFHDKRKYKKTTR